MNAHTIEKNSDFDQRGFTILELLVSVSIFSIVVFISIGAVVSVFGSNRKTDTLRRAVDNAYFAFDVMSRETRFGTEFLCGGGASCTGGESLSFTASDGKDVSYMVEDGVLMRSLDDEGYFPLTADNFLVDQLAFDLVGGSLDDSVQPLLTIYMKGRVQTQGLQGTVFDMQTSISPRVLDL